LGDKTEQTASLLLSGRGGHGQFAQKRNTRPALCGIELLCTLGSASAKKSATLRRDGRAPRSLAKSGLISWERKVFRLVSAERVKPLLPRFSPAAGSRNMKDWKPCAAAQTGPACFTEVTGSGKTQVYINWYSRF
jgi:hypothetical protein